MGWLEDVLASLQQGGAPAAPNAALGPSPFPEPAKAYTPDEEAAQAAAAREAAGQRLIRSNQRRVDPFGVPDMNSAGVQLALGQGPAGTGVPGMMPPGAPDGSPFGAPAPFGPGVTMSPSMAAAKEMTAPPPAPPQGGPLPGMVPPGAVPGMPAGPAAPMNPPTDVSAARRPAVTAAPAAVPMGVPAPAGKGFADKLADLAPHMAGLAAGMTGEGWGTAAKIGLQQQATQQAAQQANVTAQALLKKGAPAEDVMAALKSPEMLKALIGQYYAKDKGVKLEKFKDASGREQAAWVNPDTQTITPAVVPGQGEPGEQPNLNDAQQARVKAIVEGREPYPSPNTRSGDAQMIREAVHAADPSFDAVNYKSREATRLKFTKGKGADNLTAFNTAIGHLGSLDKAIDGLNNSGFPAWNKYVANPVAEQFDPKYQAGLKAFQTARTAVADELTRAFRGSGGNVHDIIQWENAINAADSPAALKTAVRAAAELLRSRIDAVGDEYNRGMGTTKDPLELLNPKAAKAFQTMIEGQRPGESSAKKPAAAVKPGNYVWKNGALVPE